MITLGFTGCAKKSYEVERSQLAAYTDRLEFIQKSVAVGVFFGNNVSDAMYFQDVVLDSLSVVKNELAKLTMPEDSTIKIHHILLSASEVATLSCRAFQRGLTIASQIPRGMFRYVNSWDNAEFKSAWRLRDSATVMIKIADSLLYRRSSSKSKQ